MGGGRSSQGRPARRRVLIVDDHPLMRRGLVVLIGNEPDLTVSAEAATHREGLEAIASCHPDLVIADLSLGDDDGLALVKDIRSGHQTLPVLVLSVHDAPGHARRAFQAGANGYVSKQEMGETVLTAIRTLLDGGEFVSSKIGLAFK
jgi:DNA-binding NarL/FixJ family response regulator